MKLDKKLNQVYYQTMTIHR